MLASTDCDDEGWAAALATALVSSQPLPACSARRLQQAFAPRAGEGVGTLRFVLAQGSPDDGLESFALIRDGSVNTGPLVPTPFFAREQPSAVQRCLQRHAVVRVDASTPDREELADWRQLRAECGCGWLLAAPLACTPARQHSSRLLGAVLVAGTGGTPSVDERWLEEWAGEMASNISHASIQLMESSLEMLGVLFPPRVLEQLVSNAAKKTGQVDLAEVLRLAATPSVSSVGSGRRGSSRPAGGLTPATAPSSLRSSLEGAEEPLPGSFSSTQRGSPPSSGERAQQAQHAQPPYVWGLAASGGSQAGHASPFAEAAAAAAASGATSPVPPGALSPSGGLRLSPSRGGSVASAVLRQASLQSALSRMLTEQEASPVSPHEWEVSGFEDLLREDHDAALARRPSMALERAHSRPTPALDQTIAAVTAAVESDGGLPAAVQAARAQAAEEGAAAAAGAACGGKDGPSAHAASDQQLPLFSKGSTGRDGMPTAAAALAAATPQQVARGAPPAVRVPWAKKPLLNPLGSGELGQEDPLSSPHQPPAMHSCFAAGACGVGPLSASPPAAAPSSDAPPATLPSAADAAPPPAGKVSSGESGKTASGGRAASRGFSAGSGSMKSGSLPSSASAGSGALAGRGSIAGGARGAAGGKLSPAAAAAARQRLDLSFAAPLLEAHYKRWTAQFAQRTDAALGVLHALEGCLVAARLVLEGPSAAVLVALAVSAVMVAAAVPAWRHSGWWAAHRTPALSAVRLLLALLVTAQVALLPPPPVSGGSSAGTLLALLGDSGASALFWLPFRFSLPFSVHLPIHLLCLWCLTVGATLAHVRGGNCPATRTCAAAPPITAVILSQLVLGFLLASLLAYLQEAGRRRRFLLTSHRAAAFLRRQALPPTSPPAHAQGPVPPPLCKSMPA